MGNCIIKHKGAKIGSRLKKTKDRDSTPGDCKEVEIEPRSSSETNQTDKTFSLSTWDDLGGDDPMWDTDAGSSFSDDTKEDPLSEIPSEGDQAWDTDAASSFSPSVGSFSDTLSSC